MKGKKQQALEFYYVVLKACPSPAAATAQDPPAWPLDPSPVPRDTESLNRLGDNRYSFSLAGSTSSKSEHPEIDQAMHRLLQSKPQLASVHKHSTRTDSWVPSSSWAGRDGRPLAKAQSQHFFCMTPCLGHVLAPLTHATGPLPTGCSSMRF